MLMFSLPAENWLRLFVWLFVGLLIHFTYGRRHSVAAQRAQKPIKDLEPVKGAARLTSSNPRSS